MRARLVVDPSNGKVRRFPIISDSDCGKRLYTRRKLAATMAAQARNRGENVRHYHCFPCGGWHIGHPSNEPRRL